MNKNIEHMDLNNIETELQKLKSSQNITEVGITDMPLPKKESINKPLMSNNDWQTNPNLWNNPNTVYLASADNIVPIHKFLCREKVLQCQNYFCCVGGLSGLNIIHRLKNLKTITFFDINGWSMRIVYLIIALIKNTSSVNEFISLIYQRDYNLDKDMNDPYGNFLKLPINKKYSNHLKKILSKDSLETYNYYYMPYIEDPTKRNTSGHPSRHCSYLLPTGGHGPEMVNPFGDPKVDINCNIFNAGEGWLQDDDVFCLTKKRIKEANINCYIGDINKIQINNEEINGIYSSNMWATESSTSAVKKLFDDPVESTFNIEYVETDSGSKDLYRLLKTAHKINSRFSGYNTLFKSFSWILGFDHGKLQYFDNKEEYIIPFHKLIGEGIRDVHGTCCMAINDVIDLNNNEFLEIIEPHITDGMEWGFRFYNGQKRIKVSDYLETNITDENIIAVHIILPHKIDHYTFYNVCKKAIKESNRYVMIFEHRKECNNFPEWDVPLECLLSHKELDRYIYSLDYRWVKYGCANIQGDTNDVRNIMYFLDKKSND